MHISGLLSHLSWLSWRRYLLYQQAIDHLSQLSLTRVFFGDPEYLYQSFYTHNVILDGMLLFGIVPMLFIIIGCMRFIIHTWEDTRSRKFNYVSAYFYAILIGSMISGGIHENWIILVIGIVGLAKKSKRELTT